MPATMAGFARQFGPFIDVRKYGATGDGVTDNTAAIQTAANAAQAAGGGIVYLPEGTYLAQGLPLYSNVRYMGAGRGATTLLLPATATNHMFYQVVPAGGSLLNSGVSSLTIDGNNAGYYGVLIDASANTNIIEQGSIFEHIRFQNCWVGWYHGADNTTAGPMLKETTVFDCQFVDCNYGIANKGVYGDTYDHVQFFHCLYGAIITVGGAFTTLGPGGDGKPAPGGFPATQSRITNFDIEGFGDYAAGTDYGMSIAMSGSFIGHGRISNTSLSMAIIDNPEGGIPVVVDDITSWGCGGGLTLWGNDGMVSSITLSNVGANSSNWPGGYTQRQSPVFVNAGTWSVKNVRGNYGAAIPAYNLDVYQGTLYAENIELPTAGTAFLHNETPATNVITIKNSPGYNPVGSVTVAIPASGTAVAAVPYDQYLYITASTSTVTVAVTDATTGVTSNATLTTALVSGTAYTSLSVTALTTAIASGADVILQSGTNNQTFVASAAVAAGATSIPVDSLAANFAYPVGTLIDPATGPTVATIPASTYAPVFIPAGSAWSLTYTTAPTALTAQGL